jgi:predicted NBD/HSP70 family sugar kinase
VTATDLVGALDIGGTHVSAGRIELRSASVDPAGRVRIRFSPAGDRAALVAAILQAARSIAGPDVLRLGVAVPGPFDYALGVSRMAHKLEALRGVDLRSELSAALGLPVSSAARFLNDADAFLLGESWAGAARGHRRAVGITLGTGLGSSFLAGGRLAHGGPGVPEGGELYRLRLHGAPVEQTISRGAVLAQYAQDGVDVEEIAHRARSGEPGARRVFDDLADALAEFLIPSLRAFEPTCLVVGGSIARSFDLLETRLCTGLEVVGTLRSVTAAERLDDAPLLGAARFAASAGT